MDKLISFVVARAYQNNRLFDQNNPTRTKYCLLKQKLEARGFKCGTQDKIDPNMCQIRVLVDPERLHFDETRPDIKQCCLLIEPKVVRPNSYRQEMLKKFDLVLTWDDVLLSQLSNARKIRFAVELCQANIAGCAAKIHQRRPKHACMIYSNQKSSRFGELYSARFSLLQASYTEGNSPIDLYGRGWESRAYSTRLMRKLATLNGFKKLMSLGYTPPQAWCGKVAEKKDVLEQYNFCVAYENAFNQEGYVSEKILDSMLSLTIPIYFGSKNIADYIPEDCFIDRRNFNCDAKLLNEIATMGELKIKGYRKAMVEFLSSPEAQVYSNESFSCSVSKLLANV